MKKPTSFSWLALSAVTLVAACGTSSSGPNPGDICAADMAGKDPVLGTLVASPTILPTTGWLQLVAGGTAGYAPSAGQIGVWDIDKNFGIDDGGQDQVDGALWLRVADADGTNLVTFGNDLGVTGESGNTTTTVQAYSDVSFSTPAMTSCTGAKTVTFGATSGDENAIAGKSAFLNLTSLSSLSQTVDLTSVTAGPGDVINLVWSANNGGNNGDMAGDTGKAEAVVYSAAGTELARVDTSLGTVDITSHVGQQLKIAFEVHSYAEDGAAAVTIDNVKIVKVNGGTTDLGLVTNGDFEAATAGSGWTVNDPSQLQNMTSAVRTLKGLEVKRSFFAFPNRLWGRHVDEFHNPTGAAITVKVSYATDLGSDNYGIIYQPAATSIVEWDGTTNGDTDQGYVIGTGATATFTSATTMNTGNGSEYLRHSYALTVPAGGTKAIVNFTVFNGVATSAKPGATIASKATEIEAEIAKILAGYKTDGQYRTGMTQAQIDAVVNF